jgi:hypothetical protein
MNVMTLTNTTWADHIKTPSRSLEREWWASGTLVGLIELDGLGGSFYLMIMMLEYLDQWFFCMLVFLLFVLGFLRFIGSHSGGREGRMLSLFVSAVAEEGSGLLVFHVSLQSSSFLSLRRCMERGGSRAQAYTHNTRRTFNSQRREGKYVDFFLCWLFLMS